MTPRASAVLFALVAVLAACSDASKEPQRVELASVAGTPIYVDELSRELRRFNIDDEPGLPSVMGDVAQKRTLLENLIERRLVLRQAEAVNVVVGLDEVEAAYKRLAGGWNAQEFERLLKEKDLTPTELKTELRDHLAVRKYFRDHVFARVAVTDDEIEDYLAKHPGLHETPEQVRARQIVVKTEELANQIVAELKAGLAFEDAAMKYSLSPEGKNGGDLGWFARGQMPKLFDDVCFTVAPGAVSSVMPSEYGFHLFKVLERRPAVQVPAEKVRDQVEALLRRDKERDAQAHTLQELRAKAQVVVKEELLARVN